jgi:RES domain-containing protein
VIVQVWRIDKKKWSATSFSGDGARLHGGRWNSPGRPLVYTSEHPALAAMEILVQAIPEKLLLRAYIVIAARFDDSLMDDLERKALPKNWAANPVPRSTQLIGNAWLDSTDSRPVLRVPSAVVSGTFNYLINPLHVHFRQIRIGKPRPFRFDSRLGAP